MIKIFKNDNIKTLIKMVLPILMNYTVLTLFEIIDKTLVGNYSTNAFAAVGIASTVIYSITGSLGVISVAYNIIAAEYIDRCDENGFNNIFFIVILLSLIIGAVTMFILLIGGRLLFQGIFALKGAILTLSLEYFHMASITILMNLVTFNFSVYFRNLKNTKISFYSTTTSTLINITFDYLLVYGALDFPKLGVKGVAIGNVLGLLFGIFIYLIKFYKVNKIKFKLLVNKKIIYKLIKLYIPLLGQDFVEGTMFTFILTGIVSRLTTYEIASYNLCVSVISIMSLPILAFATSSTTLALQKSFSFEVKDSRTIINISIIMSLIMVSVIGIIIILFPNILLNLITNNKALVKEVLKIFILVVIAQLFNVFNQIYKSYLQGIHNEKFVLKLTALVSFLSISWISVLTINFNLVGLYIGLIINNFIFTIVYYLKINKIRYLNKI